MPSKKYKQTSSTTIAKVGKYDLKREVWTPSDDGDQEMIKTKTIRISATKKK